jgi:hypothetical protein
MAPSLISIILFSGFIVAACCIHSLLDHSKRGQVLFRLWR